LQKKTNRQDAKSAKKEAEAIDIKNGVS